MNTWIKFLKESKYNGESKGKISEEYRKKYNKKIIYEYIKNPKRDKQCLKLKQNDCENNSHCYWKTKFCSKRPDRSNQVNLNLKKNQSNLKKDYSVKIINQENSKCKDYIDPLSCISNIDCVWDEKCKDNKRKETKSELLWSIFD